MISEFVSRLLAANSRYYNNTNPQKILLEELELGVYITLQYDLSVYGGEAEFTWFNQEVPLKELIEELKQRLPNTKIYLGV